MKIQNGIHVYEANDILPPLPEGLLDDIPVISKFGFKIINMDGRFYFKAATKEDFIKSETQRLGITPEEVTINESCYSKGRSCSLGCPNPLFCNPMNAPSSIEPYWYCQCS